MSNGIVNIVLRSFSQGSGFADTRNAVRLLMDDSAGLNKGLGVLARTLGNVGMMAGAGVLNLLKGGIWEVATKAVGFLVEKIHDWATASERAAAAQHEAWKKAMDGQKEYLAAAAGTHRASMSAIDEETKRINAEIDATEKLTKAWLEWERERAKQAGNDERVMEIDEKISVVENASGREKLDRALEAQRDRVAEVAKNREQIMAEIAKIKPEYDEANADMELQMFALRASTIGRSMNGFWDVVRGRHRVGTEKDLEEKVEEYKQTDSGKRLFERVDYLQKAMARLNEELAKADQEVASSQSAMEALKNRSYAYDADRQTKAMKEAAARAEAASDLAKAKLTEAQEKSEYADQVMRSAERALADAREMAAQARTRGASESLAAAKEEFERAKREADAARSELVKAQERWDEVKTDKAEMAEIRENHRARIAAIKEEEELRKRLASETAALKPRQAEPKDEKSAGEADSGDKVEKAEKAAKAARDAAVNAKRDAENAIAAIGKVAGKSEIEEAKRVAEEKVSVAASAAKRVAEAERSLAEERRNALRRQEEDERAKFDAEIDRIRQIAAADQQRRAQILGGGRGGRVQGADEFARNERKAAQEQEKRDRRLTSERERVWKRRNDLLRQRRRFGSNAYRDREIEEADRFLDLTDPKGPKSQRELQRLEKERDENVKKIREAIENGIAP